MAGGYGIHEYPQIARDKEVLLVTIRAAKSAPKLSFVTLLITCLLYTSDAADE